jgi:outer membrane lipoprotein SlyB
MKSTRAFLPPGRATASLDAYRRLVKENTITGRLIRFAMLILTATVLASCANDPVARNSAVRIGYGTVDPIEIYRSSDNQPINVGTLLGGIAGGVIGHQIGSGAGNTVAAIAGAIGGAVLGHEVEKKVIGSRYRITVRLDSGSTVIVEDSREVELRVGDRVRVENNRVFRV